MTSRCTAYAWFFSFGSFVLFNYGPRFFGTLAALGMFVTGLFSLFQELLLYPVNHHFGGDYRHIMRILTVLVGIQGIVQSARLWVLESRVKKAQRSQLLDGSTPLSLHSTVQAPAVPLDGDLEGR